MNAGQLIPDLLQNTARRLPGKIALICGGSQTTYQALDEMANRVANALHAHGVGRGDRVVVCHENSVEAVATLFGVLKAGAVIVPISPATKPEKLFVLLRDCAAVGLVRGRQAWRGGDDAKARDDAASTRLMAAVSSLKIVIECGPRARTEATDATSITWERLQATHPATAPGRTGIDLDLALILYTSGTTGEAKGVMMDHSNLIFAVESISEYLQTAEDDIILSVLPLSFGYGLNQLLLAVASGGTLVLEKSFAFPAAILERIEQQRVTAFAGVPTIFALLIEAGQNHNLSSVRYLTNAAAALPQAHVERLSDLFPRARLFSMYGLTETTRALYLPPEDLERKRGSVGIAIPGTEVWIETESGKRAAPGEVGELVVRGRHVARGYWNNQAASDQRFRPGPVAGERVCYTGDLFRTDADGYHYFVARKDDVLKCRGMKVAPREIEEVLHRLNGVTEAAVFGVPDPVLGCAIEAVLVTRDPRLTSAIVLAHCRAHLEEFMLPRQVHFVTALPRTGSGKLKRTDLPLCVESPA